MVPFRREEHSFNSSIPSLSSLSSSESSQLSYCHEEDEAMHSSHQYRIKQRSSVHERRKKVSFSEYSMLHLIPSIDNYSQEEREAMYLTEEDIDRIQEENERTIELIREGNLPDTESECFRGLECKGISHLCNQKRAMREITLSLIISEQEYGDELCPDWIEHVYCKITEDSVKRANKLAWMDAQIWDCAQRHDRRIHHNQIKTYKSTGYKRSALLYNEYFTTVALLLVQINI